MSKPRVAGSIPARGTILTERTCASPVPLSHFGSGTRVSGPDPAWLLDQRPALLAYHEATKHSPVRVRASAHYLDWDNRPSPSRSTRTSKGSPCRRTSPPSTPRPWRRLVSPPSPTPRQAPTSRLWLYS